ncbi:uncharacterized protein STEHIDRAFT_124335 [Stereum hirsutum FP-91666 SS1]|uniref:uncharacterized protein n=1 Tax=Stereum hirsutum (strain FP-91666) TaxID=721885 RepID=UPI0004449792|nr:uncharacterized protein STEHIDRAFT_124335 [Stereum hirsutum FP-91666 SS1]EIM83021.1 hypothetical protein STEHIDRAFT_124335 [Stereum hirsutum FP-91666 SS1]
MVYQSGQRSSASDYTVSEAPGAMSEQKIETEKSRYPERDGVPWFSESFFSNHAVMGKARRLYFIILAMTSFLIIFVILALMSIYWGALWNTTKYVHNVKGWIIDYDGGEIGQYFTQALNSTNGPVDTMTWIVQSASDISNDTENLIDLVVQEHAFVIVSINAGATDKLNAAASSADSSYNGSLAITVFTEEARNENAYRSVISPIVSGLMDSFAANFATQYGQRLASSSSINATRLLANSPGVITNPAGYTIYNTRPFDIPVATAVDFVGLIYLLIVSFVISLQHYGARQATGLEYRLTTRSLVLTRIAVPITMYFYLSAFFSMLSLAFQVPFDRVFGHSGFVIYWMLSWVGMCALGLAVEAMLTILTIRFIPFFLILWIISNVSVAFFPLQLLPGVFRYGYAFPFWNVSRAVRAIVFGTRNQLGLNFGILIAWAALSCCTIAVFQHFVHRKTIGEHEAKWLKEDKDTEA